MVRSLLQPRRNCAVLLKGLIRDYFRNMESSMVQNGSSLWQMHPGTMVQLNHSQKQSNMPLNVAVGEQIMTFSELQTVMYEAAQIVNQRPIGTYPDDITYLSPNDLILGRSLSHEPQGPFLERVSSNYRFDYIQDIVGRFGRSGHGKFFLVL